ncbi:hypothetical protein LAZ67_1000030 [Cordylochernes scorpioides]|uniref:Uncharacterized protein n=1 Tax=Cordylochernes scorpioides TaxID=51811 RepID=A0ABY6JVI6_9ARAC|nr:hypothetical protein LAZ67_1000030 [Cordylochernes scorpioides]
MYVPVMYGGVFDVESVTCALHMLKNEGFGVLSGNITGMFSHPDGHRSTRLTNIILATYFFKKQSCLLTPVNPPR